MNMWRWRNILLNLRVKTDVKHVFELITEVKHQIKKALLGFTVKLCQYHEAGRWGCYWDHVSVHMKTSNPWKKLRIASVFRLLISKYTYFVFAYMFVSGLWTSSQDCEIFFTQEDNVRSQFPSYRGTITSSVSVLVKLYGESWHLSWIQIIRNGTTCSSWKKVHTLSHVCCTSLLIWKCVNITHPDRTLHDNYK